jgi:hypothetical protein
MNLIYKLQSHRAVRFHPTQQYCFIRRNSTVSSDAAVRFCRRYHISLDDFKKAILQATEIEELRIILRNHPEHKSILEPLAVARKNTLQINNKGTINNHTNFSQNGFNTGS